MVDSIDFWSLLHVVHGKILEHDTDVRVVSIAYLMSHCYIWSLAGFRSIDFMACHTHVHRKKFTATAGKVENIERSESIKNHFSWKHHIINEIKSGNSESMPHFVQMFCMERTLMNNHSFQLFYFTNYTRNKHNLNHESYISSIYVHLSWDSNHPPHHRCFGQNGRSARPVDPIQDQRWWSRSLQVSDGRTCDLVCQLPCTPHNLVKSSAFYTRCLSVRSQMVAPVAASQPSLRDHRMIVHHTAELKLREQSVNNPWYFITFFPQRNKQTETWGPEDRQVVHGRFNRFFVEYNHCCSPLIDFWSLLQVS